MRWTSIAVCAVAVLAALACRPLPGATPTDTAERDARRADTRGVLPRLAAAPTVDATIDHAEWRDALIYHGVIHEKSRNIFPRTVVWYLGWTPAGLHLAGRSPLLDGETPKAATTDGAIDRLAQDDSFELRVYDADRQSQIRLVINADGTWATQRRVDRTHVDGDAGITARASTDEDAFACEVHIPFAALGHDGPGEAWRIILARNFRTGTNISAPLPYAHLGTLGRRGRVPVFHPSAELPYVQLQALHPGLYAGRPLIRLRLGNPAERPQTVTATVRIRRGDEVIGTVERSIALPPGENLPVALPVECQPAIDPDVEDEYRLDLDVVGPDGAELLHTHCTWNPTEQRAWLGDTLPGHQPPETRTLIIDPREPVPTAFQRFMDRYQDLPADHRLHIVSQRSVVPGKGYVTDSVQHITPMDADGRKHGAQTFYRNGYILEHSITWRHGVRHGPERFYSRGQNERGRPFGYLQKEIPWVEGSVQGLRRVFHPTGAVLAETRIVDGQATGVSKRFDAEGRLVRTTPYQDGLPHGTAVEYYPRRPRRVIPLRDGALEGVIIDYNWHGRIVDKTPYQDGVDLDMIPLEAGREGDGITRSVGDDGTLVTWRDAEGRVLQTAEYRDGRPDGRCIRYWPRRRQRTIPYRSGLIDGVVVDYWPNGERQRERPFVEDVLHGTERHFDRNGKLLRSQEWVDGVAR